MSTLIKLRRDTSTNWTAADPVLALGEAGIETDTLTWKVGDGTTAWNDLPYMTGGGGEAGLPLANGSSNFNIATAGGNATVTVAGARTWTFDTTGNVTIPGTIVGQGTINIDNRATGNSADIQLFSSDDITLQARDRSAGSGSEGGDINIYAGDSAEDSDSSGGDIEIFAGNGGAANVDFGGSGGFITIQSGQGGGASTEISGPSANSGGGLTLRAGDAGSANGNIARGADGGDITIRGGNSTGNLDVGGSITLIPGFGGPNAAAGSVTIDIPSSDQGPGGDWLFGGTGDTLTTPANAEISSVSGNLTVGSADNTIITSSGNTYAWTFDTNGRLNLPDAGGDGVSIIQSDVNIEIAVADAQWNFDSNGNLTLPTNESSINYANGAPYGGGGGSSGFNYEYQVEPYVADTIPGFGEIQFADTGASDADPLDANKLFINTDAFNEQNLGTIFQQWAQNSYRGTLTLNNGSDAATFNISQGRVYYDPENYRGFRAGLNQIWGDDCSINQLIITNASSPRFYNTDFELQDDVFHASGLGTGNFHVMLNVYGSSQYNPINPENLWNMFRSFVDNVLFNGETLRTDVGNIRTQFYNNTGNFRGNIPTADLFQYFTFTNSSGADYFGTAPTTTNGSGIDATVRVRVNPNNTYTVLGTANPGSGYIGGETLTVAGTSLGGATPANDLTILIDSVNGDGVITAVSYDSGTGAYPWPSNRISDGGDDQYDSGNYLNTNLAEEISYANGVPQTNSAAFGGGNYCVMYDQSFFCLVATGVSSSVTDLYYSGELGFDGDGFLNWTGLRSPQAIVANNSARYAYFDSDYLDGTLTIENGVTYNMTLDSAGIDLDGFYAYTDPDSNNHYLGSNDSWRLESQQNLYVQSYADMFIQTRVNQRGTGETGPTINIDAGDGSPGQREINATAGNGGSLNIRGGDAGSSDGIDGLGNTGGDVNIDAGDGTGASAGGTVYVRGGDSNNGTAGDVTISTSSGEVGNGQVNIRTNDGTGDRNWAFKANGSTIFPTLTVTRGDRTGTLTGQTLLFGDIEQGVIISTPNGTNSINDSQRIVINPGAGYANTTGEGGDIYLYAGRGGDAGGTGGDIKIRGGLGPVNGDGGYLDIVGGEADGNGQGGYIEIRGGQSANAAGGFVRVIGGQGRTGAEANLIGGTGSAGSGGAVNIAGGTSSNGLPEYGNVNITSGASTWRFDNTGNLVLPTDDFTVNYANGSPVTFGAAALGNVTFDDNIVIGTGDEYGGSGLYLAIGTESAANLQYFRVRGGDTPTHLHLDTGNNDQYDQYFGDDGKYVKLELGSSGNIIVGTDNNNYNWTFGADGNLTLPRGGVVYETNIPDGMLTGNTIALKPQGGIDADQQLLVYPTAVGADANHLHITTGNLYNTELFLGNDNLYVKLANTGNIVVNSNDALGNTAQWSFDALGNLILPSDGYLTTPVGSNGNINIHPEGTGVVVIKGNAAGALLTVTGDEVNSFNRIEVDTYGNLANLGGAFTGTFSRGTPSAPQAVQNQDRLSVFTGKGYDGSALSLPAAQITMDAVGNWSPSNHGSHISFYTTQQNTTVQQEVVRIYGVGDLHQIVGNIVIENGDLNLSGGGNITGANVVIANAVSTTGNITTTANVSAGNISTTGTLTATGKIGYRSGSTVTQTVNRGNGVTINALAGTIITTSAAMVATQIDTFSVANNQVDPNNDIVLVQIVSPNFGVYNCIAQPSSTISVSLNGFYVNIQNISGFTTSNEAITIRFMVIKAPNA